MRTLALATAFAATLACSSPPQNADASRSCAPSPPVDPHAVDRERCLFAAGSRVAETLGFDATARARFPITHVIVVMQENRSFDHILGRLNAAGQRDADSIPDGWQMPDATGATVTPMHAATTCIQRDPPHQWPEMHAAWNGGAMDGFVRTAAVNGSDGHYVLSFNDDTDVPFYYWLANTFATSDRYFGAVLGGTWANRDYLYAGTSNGVMNTGQATLAGVRTIFDELDAAQVPWRVFTEGMPRQECLGWTLGHRGVNSFDLFLAQLTSGALPSVSFVDPFASADEHPTGDLQRGEAWFHRIYDTAIASPLWPHLAIFFTYDESGGFADHVAPPAACIPSADQTAFDRRGIRVPLYAISPWARPHSVSHVNHDHTSILRFIELVHDLPALTARDANADAMLDLFDFECPSLLHPPRAPAAGTGRCP